MKGWNGPYMAGVILRTRYSRRTNEYELSLWANGKRITDDRWSHVSTPFGTSFPKLRRWLDKIRLAQRPARRAHRGNGA